MALAPRSAVLLVSHGTVDALDDLAAFVTNVRRGSPPSPELVAELRRRYEAIGGQSPLNAVNAAVAAKLAHRLGARVAWANRLWKPYTRDVLAALAREGVADVAVVPLAQHSAQVYADDARAGAEGTGLRLACAANWGRSPALCAAFAERIVRALQEPGAEPAATTILMTAHSLPQMIVARGDPYAGEVAWAAAAVAALVQSRVGFAVPYQVAFQSQGPPAKGRDGAVVEWLGPDLRAALDGVRASGSPRVLFAPLGFLADHVEILYDLDVEARGWAAERGLGYARAASLNDDDDLVEALAGVARPLLGG